MMETPIGDLISQDDTNNKLCPPDSMEIESDESFSSVNESEGGLDTMEKVDTLIGGARVISNKVKRNDDEQSATKTEANQPNNYHNLEKDQASAISLDPDDEDLDEIISYSHDGNYDSSHKTFSFSLPFGNTNFRSSSPLAIFKTVLPKTPDEFIKKNLRKNEIRQKLKKSTSISSLEEIELFKYERGIDNSRLRAVKESLEMDALKNSIKQITADPFDKTHDGYYLSLIHI